MTLGVEELEDRVLIYWDDSTWQATVKEGNTFEAFRYHEIQDSKEACHTAQSEVLELEITEDRVKKGFGGERTAQRDLRYAETHLPVKKMRSL